MQLVSEAIDRSISHNQIVTIDVGPSGLVCAGGGVSGDAVREDLAEVCEDCAISKAVCEYWGNDLEGNEWRVHVRPVDL